ncbi:MAG: hypothetical protein LBN98_00580 [Prevotellaceae bacterium]|jgi:hypothetical protein|nr:hypothetical protein [Prevotellaceae bacterium]
MEQKHTIKEMQDYITAQECIITVMGQCNNIRNNTTNQKDIELIGFYMQGLSRLLNSLNIGASLVNEALTKYAPLVKNHKINMEFIKNEYRKLRPFVQNTIFNEMGQPVRKNDDIGFIHAQTAPVASVPIAV